MMSRNRGHKDYYESSMWILIFASILVDAIFFAVVMGSL